MASITAFGWATGLVLAAAPAADFDLVPGTTIRLASREEAAEILGARDEFALALSPYDRAARLRRAGDVSVDELLAFAREQAREWEDGEAERLRDRLRSIGKKLEAAGVSLPARVLLVKTTGTEEGGAAYTRGAAVVLKSGTLASTDSGLERLLVHELFHVLSRSAPALRRDAYACVGFVRCGDVSLPPGLSARKLTNPDAPRLDWRIELEADGRAVSATPILLAPLPTYDPAAGKDILRGMLFRLLVIEEGSGGAWKAAARDGAPWLLEPDATPSFHAKIGANTGYVIHPEETLADNFVLLVEGKRDVPTPRVLEGLREALRRRRRV